MDESIRSFERSGDKFKALNARRRLGETASSEEAILDAQRVLEEANCHDHEPDWTWDAEDVFCVVYYRSDPGDYAESDSEAVYWLRDGRFAYAWENCDTTGHG